jgi:hypothetical protein
MKRCRTALAAVALVATVPVAIWGLWGQQNAPGVPPSELDYAYRPWDLPPGLDTALGWGALILTLATTAALVLDTVRQQLDARWWSVLAPLVVAGLAVGSGQRVLTAGGIGANIGAGIALLLVAPATAALILGAAGRAVWVFAHPRHRPPGTAGPVPHSTP